MTSFLGKRTVAASVAALTWAGASMTTSAQQAARPAGPAGIRPKVACAAMAGKMVPASAISLPTSGAVVTSATLEPGSGPLAVKNNFVPEH